MIQFLICLIVTIVVHEFGHLLTAILCKVKVKAFSIGLGKPYLHFKWKNIDWRLTPFLLGGYCDIAGENDLKDPQGLLNQRYIKKFIILIAGVLMNSLIAIFAYLWNFGSIKIGLYIDFLCWKALFTHNYNVLNFILHYPNINLFLLQLSVLNSFIAITNLIPIPPLDGGYLWFMAIRNRISNILANLIIYFGIIFLTVIQIIFLILIYRSY